MPKKKAKKRTVKMQVYEYLLYVNKHSTTKRFSGFGIQTIDRYHPLSGLRRLRDLRSPDKMIDYKVLDNNKSLYELLWIKEEE